MFLFNCLWSSIVQRSSIVIVVTCSQNYDVLFYPKIESHHWHSSTINRNNICKYVWLTLFSTTSPKFLSHGDYPSFTIIKHGDHHHWPWYSIVMNYLPFLVLVLSNDAGRWTPEQMLPALTQRCKRRWPKQRNEGQAGRLCHGQPLAKTNGVSLIQQA